MIWKKLGLVYSAKNDGGWKDNSALTPTAFYLNEDVIRVYAGFRDRHGVSRVGYVDLSSEDPRDVIGVSKFPVLDVGRPGMFDDNGVILGDVVRVSNEIRMYYVGFQLVDKVKFLAYSGLAISVDGGNSFARYSETPILDRADEGVFIRAIHSIRYENGIYKIWYATGNSWEIIDGKSYPRYDINYIESNDGINFPRQGRKVILNNKNNLEYRIGRPRVYEFLGKYLMNFTYGTVDGRYQAGLAVSEDGVRWTRCDESLGISRSESGWDSIHLCYPSIVTVSNGNTYMFYNGNNMGVDGFGCAILSESSL
ncbi:putative protein [Castellaniella caeni]